MHSLAPLDKNKYHCVSICSGTLFVVNITILSSSELHSVLRSHKRRGVILIRITHPLL